MRSVTVLGLVPVLALGSPPASAQVPATLSPQALINTDLAPGAVHSYELRLAAGESAEVTVTQRGIDVVVEVLDEQDSLLFSMDSPNGREGPEIVELISPRASSYKLRIRPYDEREPEGHYTLEVTAWRDAAATREHLAARERARLAAAAWLGSRSVPLPQVTETPPRGTLAPIDSLASRAIVIGLGEATHGSREFGDLRLVLTRYLVQHHGFRLVGIEASSSRLAVLDRYARGGGMSDSIAGILETGWIGRRPLRELVGWLHEWNRLHPGDQVQLVGLDPQENEIARRDLRDFITRAYPQAVERYAAAERELAAADSQASVFGNSSVDDETRSFLREIVAQGEADAPLLRRLMDETQLRTGLNAAHLLLQFAEFNAGNGDIWSRSRDWYMAVNLLGALKSTPEIRAVVWAHNAHIAAPSDRSIASQPMGSCLRAALGCRYGAVAMTFGRGAFVAQIPNDLEDDLAINTLPGSPAESIEDVLETLGQAGTLAAWPCETGADLGLPEWLQKPQRMHWVGALFTPGTDPSEAFRPFRLVIDFDGIAFIPVVTAEEMPTDRPLIPARRP